MARKKTNTQFIAEIKEKFDDEFVFLEEYQGAKTPILCRHKCGYEWSVSPTNILSGKGCPKCSGKIHYSLDDAKVLFANKGLELLAEEYVDANTSMPYICLKHKNKGVQHRTLSAIINTNTPGCKYCGYELSSKKQLNPDLYDEMYNCFLSQGLKLLDTEYRGVYAWYNCKCINNDKHGVIKKRYVDVKYQHQGCPKCGHESLREARRKNIDYYKNIVESKGYIFVDVKYNHRDDGGTKIYYICPKHSQFGVQEKHVSKIKTQGCSYCAESQGELEIRVYLENHDIEFNTQFWFDDLRGVGGLPLSYDFYLPQYNCLIEFQGIQHEKPVDLFGGEKQFLIQKEHDRRKKEYALTQGYGFIEIWYTDINDIESILDSILFLNDKAVG